MKLLLVILGTVILVDGNAIEPNDSLSEADIKRVGEELLKQLKRIKEDIHQIEDDTSYVIHVKFKQNPEVKQLGERIFKALIKKTMSPDCAAMVDAHYFGTVHSISADILKNTLKIITNDEDSLNIIHKDLDKLQSILEQNLDQEVRKCVNGSNACRITGEFTESIDELARIVDLINLEILSHTENEVSSDGFQDKIKTFIADLPKCLIEQKKSDPIEELLRQLLLIKENIKQIQDDIIHAVMLKVNQIPEVKQLGVQYNKALIKSMNTDCVVSVSEYYVESLNAIIVDILKKTLKNIINDEDSLNVLQRELDFKQTTLDQNLNQVQKCVNDSESCSISEDFIQSTEKLLILLDLIKHKIISDTDNEFSSADFQDRVIKAYIANVPKCLIEQKK